MSPAVRIETVDCDSACCADSEVKRVFNTCELLSVTEGQLLTVGRSLCIYVNELLSGLKRYGLS